MSSGKQYLQIKWALFVMLGLGQLAQGQFYRGMDAGFGKNRIQREERIWMKYQYENYNVYFYTGGRELAIYTSQVAKRLTEKLERKFNYYLNDKVYFLLYNGLNDLRESNIGYDENAENNLGGISEVLGAKIFVYFNGSHEYLDYQINRGITRILINHILYGENWKELVKNTALLSFPDWFLDGVVSYYAEPLTSETQDRIKDLVLSKKYLRFNWLENKNSEIAGWALWNYIAQSYGENVIPNILYMSRISRNIESGFLFVLGVSIETLIKESYNFYKRRFLDQELKHIAVEDEELFSIKNRGPKIYKQFAWNSDSSMIAYASHEMGKHKVWVYDIKADKKDKVLRGGIKLDRIEDEVYPLIDWHPNGKILSIISEKDGKPHLTILDTDNMKSFTKPIFHLQKVHHFGYSADGKEMILSATKNGQSDIFLYKVSSNSHKQLTNDIYDDLNPRFIGNTRDIIFASNRTDDTLSTNSHETDSVDYDMDLFLLKNGADQLIQLTNTPLQNESHPISLNGKDLFGYLAPNSGAQNSFLLKLDSIIDHIDTVVHYRYVSKISPLNPGTRNILEYDVSIPTFELGYMALRDGKYVYSVQDISYSKVSSLLSQPAFDEEDLLNENKRRSGGYADISSDTPIKEIENDRIYYKIVAEQPPKPKKSNEEKSETAVDINNYIFEAEKVKPADSTLTKPKPKEAPIENNTTKEPENQTKESEPDSFYIPSQENYKISYTLSKVETKLQLDFENQIYQRYNGGPFVNTGLGPYLTIALNDLFNDYKIEGGVSSNFSRDNNEFFLGMSNLSKRLDKRYVFFKQLMTNVEEFSLKKVHTYMGRYILKWPFFEVLSLKSTLGLRHDRVVTLSIDQNSLEVPDVVNNWSSFKLELIYDDIFSKGMNLYNGSRAKLFSETYYEFGQPESAMQIFGMDLRNYLRVHRSIVWANRLAWSSSVGKRKLLYYMGAVDNWMVLTQRPRFDTDMPIDDTQNYYFQTLATNLRGFIQNSRNGNSFAVINSELRLPLFKYLSTKPLKSEFISTFQVVGFADVGTAWTGPNPYSDANAFNTVTIDKGSIMVVIENIEDPILIGYGVGLRAKLWGYFVKLDHAWSVRDQVIQKPMIHLSLGLDF